MRYSCKTCPERADCTEICKSVESILPRLHEGTWSELNEEDRAIARFIQEHEKDLPDNLRRVARLYYRLGWDQEHIAKEMGVKQYAISRFLRRIRREARRMCIKTLLYRGTDQVPEDEGGEE